MNRSRLSSLIRFIARSVSCLLVPAAQTHRLARSDEIEKRRSSNASEVASEQERRGTNECRCISRRAIVLRIECSTDLFPLESRRQSLDDSLALCATSDRDPQASLATEFLPPEPHDDLVLLGHVLVQPLAPLVVGHVDPLLVADLDEQKVGVGFPEDPDHAELFHRGREELFGQPRAVLLEDLDVRVEFGEAVGRESSEGERSGWGRDVVRSFDVVEDLNQRW